MEQSKVRIMFVPLLVSDMENISNRMDENQEIAAALQKETNVFKNF